MIKVNFFTLSIKIANFVLSINFTQLPVKKTYNSLNYNI